MTQAELPFRNLRVVSFEQAVAAPLCTRHLADLGAEVIKVERRGEGDFARGYDSVIHGTSTWFAWLNRGKRSLSLDLKTKGGIEIAGNLVAGADVVVQNFAPGAFDRLGLGASRLREDNPALIVASITGYGEDGPYRERKAYDLLVQAEAGVLSVTGTPEQPSKSGVSLVDLSAGIYAFGSIVSALYRRKETGEGASISVSLFDSVLEWMTPLALMANYGATPQRAGANHASIVPYGPYAVAGGRKVMLAVQNNREWQRFCELVLEQPPLANDPRFETNEKRLANRAVLEAMIESLLCPFSVEVVEERLENAGLPYSRMNEVGEVFGHEQLRARNRLLTVSVPGGTVELPRSPFNIEGLEEPGGCVPALGEHTEEILFELGFDRKNVEAFRAAGAI